MSRKNPNIDFQKLAAKGDAAQAVFDASLGLVFDDEDEDTEHLERLSRPARLVYLLFSLEAEINNGGFDQVFGNSIGNHCEEMLGHLETVKAAKLRRMLERGMALFPSSLPSRDWEQRRTQLEGFSDDPRYQDEIERLDNEFYDSEFSLVELLDKYVGDHPDAKLGA